MHWLNKLENLNLVFSLITVGIDLTAWLDTDTKTITFLWSPKHAISCRHHLLQISSSLQAGQFVMFFKIVIKFSSEFGSALDHKLYISSVRSAWWSVYFWNNQKICTSDKHLNTSTSRYCNGGSVHFVRRKDSPNWRFVYGYLFIYLFCIWKWIKRIFRPSKKLMRIAPGVACWDKMTLALHGQQNPIIDISLFIHFNTSPLPSFNQHLRLS